MAPQNQQQSVRRPSLPSIPAFDANAMDKAVKLEGVWYANASVITGSGKGWRTTFAKEGVEGGGPIRLTFLSPFNEGDAQGPIPKGTKITNPSVMATLFRDESTGEYKPGSWSPGKNQQTGAELFYLAVRFVAHEGIEKPGAAPTEVEADLLGLAS